MFIACISVSQRMPGLKKKSLLVIARPVDNGGLVKIYTMAAYCRCRSGVFKVLHFN